jgi:hypothetical protein
MLTESRTGKELMDCSKLGFFTRLLISAISPVPFQSIGSITACLYRWSTVNSQQSPAYSPVQVILLPDNRTWEDPNRGPIFVPHFGQLLLLFDAGAPERNAA